MPTNINADNGVVSGIAGLKTSADNSGVLALQSNGTTALTVSTTLALGVGSTPSYGTAGQVLTSAGSGAPPTWSSAGGSSQWTTTGSNIYYTTGKVFINTTTGSDGRFCVDQDVDSTAFRGINVRSADVKKFVGAFGINSTGDLAISQSYDGGTGSYKQIVFNTGANRKLSINESSGAIALQDAVTTANGVGITFPATQSASTNANTLDDYEEGTWTPVIIGTTTAGTGTYTTQTGSYTKIGNQVTLHLTLTWTAHTGTGNMRISGLPFTVGSYLSAGSVGLCDAISLTASNSLAVYSLTAEARLALVQNPTGGGTAAGVPMDTSAGPLVISITYTV